MRSARAILIPEKQTVLRTIHEVFESCYTEPVQGAVVNGWATVTNRSGPGAKPDEDLYMTAIQRKTSPVSALR